VDLLKGGDDPLEDILLETVHVAYIVGQFEIRPAAVLLVPYPAYHAAVHKPVDPHRGGGLGDARGLGEPGQGAALHLRDRIEEEGVLVGYRCIHGPGAGAVDDPQLHHGSDR